MNRCSNRTLRWCAPWIGLLLACLPLLAVATEDETADATVQTTTPSSNIGTTSNTSAMVPMALARLLPPTSLRGELVINNPQAGTLNGQSETLAPGMRVRGANNMLLAPGMLMGQKFNVNYLRDSYGLVFDVWILRGDERAKRWPKTAAEAATWLYDPYTQTWTKP
jgi:hypothetical protein